MPTRLLEQLGDSGVARLREAMDWVIPTDSSPGASSDAGVRRLAALVDSLGDEMVALYLFHVPKLKREDLISGGKIFAVTFIEHVRDIYYATADTGAWADIGFKVTA